MKSRLSQWNSAFTLVELLVVIAIIGVLVAAIMPALVNCREVSRRMQCSHHLGNLGLALQQYEVAYLRYPAGCLSDVTPVVNQPSGKQHGWLIAALPYLERGDAYRLFVPGESVFAAANAPLRKLTIAIMQCPSDASDQATSHPISSYAGVYHHVESPLVEGTSGALPINTPLRIEDFRDGLASTLLLGEKRSDPSDLGWLSGSRATLRNTGLAPNSASTIPADATFVGGFGGPHAGGAWFVLGDGQTRFLVNEISPAVLQALAQRADGTAISDDAF